jgi:hypothetical protein
VSPTPRNLSLDRRVPETGAPERMNIPSSYDGTNVGYTSVAGRSRRCLTAPISADDEERRPRLFCEGHHFGMARPEDVLDLIRRTIASVNPYDLRRGSLEETELTKIGIL